MNIHEVAAKYNEYIIEQRRYFHQHPEVSTREYETSKAVAAQLDKMGVPYVHCGLETGLLATIQGAKPGKTILIRGDMDALTVKETTGAPYASQNDGLMHACGHDCHIAMMLTAAQILNDMKDELCGTVKLAFQPAEEVALGAKSMIEQGALEGVDGCFAIHVWGTVKSGLVSLEAGPRMASAGQFIIDVKGKGCHGAQPEQGVDAAVVTASIVNNLQSIVSREISPMDPAVVTVGTIQCGSRWNVVAENGHIEGTTRCFSNEVWNSFEERLSRVAKTTAAAYRAEATMQYIELVPPTVNDTAFVALAQNAVKSVMGENALVSAPATTGGEDFAFFMQKVPGAVALLGIATDDCCWPNHSPNFDVDEAQLINGAMMYAQVAMDFNAQ